MKWFRWLLIVFFLALLVAVSIGCAGSPTPAIPPTTALIVAPTTAPAAAPTTAPAAAAQGTPGGTLRICAWEEVPNLNPYTCCVLGYDPEVGAILQRLISFDPDGKPFPVLATEVPTVENGGLSKDGKTVTYHLRPGVKWADGEPFTSADVKFSYEYIMKPENQVSSRAGFELVESIETPDPLTAVVHFKQYYAPWMTIPWFIIPKHILEKEPNFNSVDWDTKMIGTGPFYVTESVAGDHLTLSRNEYYWEPGKPLLDQVVILWISDREAQKARFKAGDCDMVVDLVETDIANMKTLPGVDLYLRSGGLVERLWLNLSADSGPHMGDPQYPHFFLGDLKVRQALELAINKQEMVNTVLSGVNKVGTSDCPGGWAEPTIPASEFNPAKAKQLLDEAGWTVGKDGIRECHGCKTAKEGDKASIILRTTSAKFRQLDAQLIQKYFKDVGVDLKIETPEGGPFWGGFSEGGLAATGNYDMDMWTELCWVDPAPTLEQTYGAAQIPTATNSAGRNKVRFVNEEFEQLLDQGRTALTLEERANAYKRAQEILVEQKPIIYLFERADISAVRSSKVKDWMPPEGKPNNWIGLSNYFQNIYLTEK
jgi:peptide/nickel transport system substrate-binding protein